MVFEVRKFQMKICKISNFGAGSKFGPKKQKSKTLNGFQLTKKHKFNISFSGTIVIWFCGFYVNSKFWKIFEKISKIRTRFEKSRILEWNEVELGVNGGKMMETKPK